MNENITIHLGTKFLLELNKNISNYGFYYLNIQMIILYRLS